MNGVKQISVFLENKSGRLAAVSKILGANDINIRALCIADTSDFGILRLIVNDPERAYGVLKESGFTVSATNVIAVQVPDRPGGLAEALTILEEAGLNIEYLYAFVSKVSGRALVILKVEDVDRAADLLRGRGIPVPHPEEVYAL
ncbi:MAG: Amino acid-binding ACT domain protein [Clostridia bacterium 62_21]|nr:MAG: Amino acid-binding ACT domain protein [Clostridia bacterium 62_21]